MNMKATTVLLAGLLLPQFSLGWTPASISRREAFASVASATFGSAFLTTGPSPAFADDTTAAPEYRFEKRDRNMNKDAVIKEDYWYNKGVTPPRLLNNAIVLDDPKWNSFGSCETSGGDASASNSCTYISLKQRQPAYSKYGFSIAQGGREFQQLKPLLENKDWNKAAKYIFINPDTNLPPAAVDAQLKMVLFASLMLTSPNYSGSSMELLVARFYVNEFKYAVTEIGDAIKEGDQARALAAWDFGRDSFNSYSQVVNRQIVEKVGDKFTLIQ